MGLRLLSYFSPGQIILFSVFATIMGGTFLLALPIAQQEPLSFFDLFFTATSATCVTGLFTVSIDSFTLFGKAVILLLIQIGGLGLITMTLFLLTMFVRLGLATQVMAEQVLEIGSWRMIQRLLILIILITLICELVGALWIASLLSCKYPFGLAFFMGLFHTVSSFCNAGIPFSDQWIALYGNNALFLCITTALMYIGGMGFITWYEIIDYVRTALKGQRYRFSLHSKIVLYGSSAMLIASCILFWILEHNNTLAYMSVPRTILYTIFYGVSFKSTGFSIIPLGELQLATLFLAIIISFIGSSPGSTGSGIKITTFTIFLATIKAAISSRTSVDIKGRQIPKDLVYKAVTITALGIFLIICTTFCLLITEKDWGFFDLFFEASTAFSAIGLSTGVTPTLSSIGKIFIIISMLIGRIGLLTLVLALKLKKKGESTDFSYPEERVMLG